MTILDATGNRQSTAITSKHHTSQVLIRVFAGSIEGEGGTPLPVKRPLDHLYSIEGLHGGGVDERR